MAVSLDVDILPPPFMFSASMGALALDIRSFREPLKRAVQGVVAPSFQHNFDVGGRPTWVPLADVTRDIKSRLGYEMSPLVRTELLRKVAGQLNLWDIDRETATATLSNAQGGRADYGGFHQEGTRFMPERPWAVIQPQDEEEIEQVFWAWILERLVLHGWRPGATGVLQEMATE